MACRGKQTRTNIFFRDWTFLSEIVGREDSCLPSEARLDSPSDRRSRKKKSNQGNKSLSKIVFPCRVNTIVTKGDTFFCLYGVCPTISPNLWIPLAWMLFMDPPLFIEYYRSLRLLQQWKILRSKIFHFKRSLSDL